MRSSLAAVATAIGLAVQQPPISPPAFRSGIDLVQVDVSVLDRARQPVRGLGAADFTVLEDGKPRPIVSFDAIDLAAPPRLAAATSELGADVATNAIGPTGRLVVILIDWTIRPQDMPRARGIAKAAIEQLGPDDLAAVIYNVRGTPQNFTADRRRLRVAVDRPFMGLSEGDYGNPGECYCGTCTLEAMVNVADTLRDAPQRQKMLLFIGEDVPVLTSPQIAGCDSRVTTWRNKVIEAAHLANLTIHVLDARGLEATGAPGASEARFGNLMAYPANTGGRAIVNTNAPADLVPALFKESASYYLIAFAPANPRADGRTHTIGVTVKDRTLSVHARHGYVEPREKDGADAASGVERAIGGLLPSTGLNLRATAAAFPTSAREAAVLVALGVRAPEDDHAIAGTEHVEIVAGAFDPHGTRIASAAQRMEVTMPPEAAGRRYHAVLRLDLKPGAYELRIAAEHRTTRRVGSLSAYIDVPDSRKAAVSLSDIVLQGDANLLATPPRVFDTLVRGAPTPNRQFSQTAHITAFARVYQNVRDDKPREVILRASIVDAAGRTAVRQPLTLEPAAFDEGHTAEWHLDLPLPSLVAGDYLLTLEAAIGNNDTRRQLRFTVR